MQKMHIRIFLFAFLLLAFSACKKEEDLTPKVEVALSSFATSLQADPPTAATISDRVKAYITAQPNYFFGSTVTLLDANGVAVTSPYWYRGNGTLLSKELANATYNINTQVWLRKPADTKLPYWTEPYFDAGGGEIWMKTYAYPIIINTKVIAVATTDLAVKKP